MSDPHTKPAPHQAQNQDPEPERRPPSDPDAGLIFAVTLPGQPNISDKYKSLNTLPQPSPTEPPLWIHLDRTRPQAADWIRNHADLDPLVAEALLAEETRPRAAHRSKGILVILRGINLNQGAEPDDLISIRMWVEPHRIITLRQHRFSTLAPLRQSADLAHAPPTTHALLAAIATALSAELLPVVDNLTELLDDDEDQLAEGTTTPEPHHAARLADIRRQAIRLRRYLAPQRDALLSLALSPTFSAPPIPLNQTTRTELHEAAERTARVVDDLEELRDRAAVNQEELRAQREIQTNRRLYVLTLVATVLLPLGFITGLLGINVGGIPGTESPTAFWIVTATLLTLAIATIIAFRRLKWL